MIKNIFLTITFLILSLFKCYSQNDFRILNNRDRETIHFKLVNNLILLPVIINGEELTFLLDTGVKQSLLFNVSTSDSLDLKQVKKIKIRGLGENEEFDALKSKNNLFRINNIICPNFELLVILDQKFEFSARMGVDIHGIIGSELFKDFILEINYNKKKIIFNNPKTYKYKKCKSCETFPITFHHQKPYIDGNINTFDGKIFPVKLLIDSGSGDSLWIFKNSLEEYVIPEKHIKDLLGQGLGGNIFGVKSKLTSFIIGNFKFNELIVSHPDSTSAIGNNISFKRNGLIGAKVLNRFHIIYDYPHNKVTFKKNRQHYNTPFFYNKSGIELIHYGKVLVKEKNSKMVFIDNNDKNNSTTDVYTTYSFSFKNAYQISYVKPKSIAANVGIQKGDIISKLNGKDAYHYTLQQIIQKLSDKEGRTIKIKVSRNGQFYDYKFTLKDIL
jgi:hypothetical protein